MRLTSDTQLANTRAKLERLEARYETLRTKPSEDDELRAVTLRSLKRYINQFKEEIARYEAHPGEPTNSSSKSGARRQLLSKSEAENTRKKLRDLESMYESHEKEAIGDEDLRQMELESLKRLINQFKEEIARYEAHQPAG